MSISRKDFFKQGFFSLGKTALNLADTLSGSIPVGSSEVPRVPPESEPRPDLRAEAFNERCLARNCSCISCVECCKPSAILLIPGVGVRINPQLCNGCGSCEYVCPVEPKAVVLVPR
jgi:Pyruvate/2-oxoacid:ferredoxin oxidoreductase delta subunit